MSKPEVAYTDPEIYSMAPLSIWALEHLGGFTVHTFESTQSPQEALEDAREVLSRSQALVVDRFAVHYDPEPADDMIRDRMIFDRLAVAKELGVTVFTRHPNRETEGHIYFCGGFGLPEQTATGIPIEDVMKDLVILKTDAQYQALKQALAQPIQ